MNKEIIAPASNNKHRYFSLYEEDININSQLKYEDRLRSIDLWQIFITTSLKIKNNNVGK